MFPLLSEDELLSASLRCTVFNNPEIMVNKLYNDSKERVIVTEEHKDQAEKMREEARKQAEEGQEQKAQMKEKAQAEQSDFKDDDSKAWAKQDETQGSRNAQEEEIQQEKGNNQFNQYR